MLRLTALALSSLLIAACASGPQRPEGLIDIQTTTRGQALPGAVNVGEPSGDLWVVCNRAGYRTSEVIVRAAGSAASGTRVGVGMGGGFGRTSGVGLSLGMGFPLGSSRVRYPAQVVVDLTPLNSPQ